MSDAPVTDPGFNPSNNPQVATIKETALLLESAIRDNSKPGRRQSLALTNLETAVMYAVKAAVVGDT
jgi:hypothetical protein